MSSWLDVIAVLISTILLITLANKAGYISITEEDNNYTIQMNERLNEFCESKNMTLEYYCNGGIKLFNNCREVIACKDNEDRVTEFKPNLTEVFKGITTWCEMKGWC